MKDVLVYGDLRSGIPPEPWRQRIRIPMDQLRTRTNADGWFTLHLPAGRYWLSADPCSLADYDTWQSEGGLSYGLSDPRVLEVIPGDEPQQVDFSLGRVDLTLQASPQLEGRFTWYAEFYRDIDEPRHSVVRTELTTESRILVEGIVPDAYLIRLTVFLFAHRGVSRLWMSRTAHYSEADSIIILPDETTGRTVSLPEPGTLRGRVYGNLELARRNHLWAQANLEGVPRRVMLGRQASSKVDSLGEYCISFFTPSRVRLAISTMGAVRWYGGTCFEDAAVFEVGPGKTVWADHVGVSAVSYELKGVRAPDSVRATIMVHDSTGHCISRSVVHHSRKQPICNLAPGSYFLNITPEAAQGWRPQWYDRASSFEEATPVVISSEGEKVDISFTLEKGGSIHGRVLRAGGQGAPSMLDASVPGFPQWCPCGFWAVDSSGHFIMDGLPDGEIKIGAGTWSHCVRLTWYPGTASADSARSIVIEDAGDVTGIEWQLLPSR